MFLAFRPVHILGSDAKPVAPAAQPPHSLEHAQDDGDARWMFVVDVPPRIGDGYVREGDRVMLVHLATGSFFNREAHPMILREVTAETEDTAKLRLIQTAGTQVEIELVARVLSRHCELARFPFACTSLEERATASVVASTLPSEVGGKSAQELVRFLIRNKTQVTRETVMYYADRMGLVSHATTTSTTSGRAQPASSTLQLRTTDREKEILLGHEHRV